jgi:hypothetical protein
MGDTRNIPKGSKPNDLGIIMPTNQNNTPHGKPINIGIGGVTTWGIGSLFPSISFLFFQISTPCL